MKKIVIISKIQFGYNSATYYYCKYLRHNYSTVYICWNTDRPKIEMDGIQVYYVERTGNLLIRTIRFLRQSLKQINDHQTIVLIKYFNFFPVLLRFCRPMNNFVLDVRTGSVHEIPVKRKYYDAILRFEIKFFKNLTVISKSLAEKLFISHKSHVLPLGADIISLVNKSFDNIHLLYVGTLYNRNIDETIHGFKKFYDIYKDKVPVTYTIIGSGVRSEEANLKKIVFNYGLTKVVNITGRIPHIKLKSYFDTANIGVTYIPLTDYYDCQPVTKNFEYLLSGMPVIATHTSENRKVINQDNGVLIGDSAENFYVGLETIFIKRHLFCSEKIRNKSVKYSWKNIVQNNLIIYLKKVQKCNRYNNKACP